MSVYVNYAFKSLFSLHLRVASAGNSYSKEDIKQLIELANDYKFEVIPLIQTFGHLEFFLKLEQFRHLREIDEFPQVLLFIYLFN
jgi:hexosaminidase